MTRPVPIAAVHDFTRKLRQPSLVSALGRYVAWQRGRRAGGDVGPLPVPVPVSINLDLTTACNYACDHCIDWETLNSGISYERGVLEASLTQMAGQGLRSVILIGGGEPTVHPGFEHIVRLAKSLGLQIAVVSNGSRNDRLRGVMDVLSAGDWVRLSLDAGTDGTFQAMHRPKKPITLEQIVEGVPPMKAANPAVRVGFSYIVTWEGAHRTAGAPVIENIHEIVEAARLARDHGFDYITYKPFLVRTPEGAEVMDPEAAVAAHREVVSRIRARVDEARALATADFAVMESTNLKLLETETWRDWTRQPRTCHMQAFRQVLSPLGLWNCPAHRGVPKARITGRGAHADAPSTTATARETVRMLDDFDASVECREVTCLYHATNWWIESAIEDPRAAIEEVAIEEEDAFL